MTPIRIGTCSFADEALTKVSTRPESGRNGRLAHYATVFDTVEIDSTFYRLQPPETVAKWADAVPDGFVFHVKAFAPMTRHGVKHDVLPEPLATTLAPDERGRVERMPRTRARSSSSFSARWSSAARRASSGRSSCRWRRTSS